MKFIESNKYFIESNHKNSEYIDADWHDQFGLLVVQKIGNQLKILINETNIVVEIDFEYPIIRWVDLNHFLVADSRNESDMKNLFIFNTQGDIKNSLNCGDAITDIAVTNEGIWISYFDEGIFGKGISTEGLVLFDLKGYPLLNFNTYFKNRLFIADCNAMCKGTLSTIWIFTQVSASEYKLVNLNIDNKILKVYDVPNFLNNCNSICIKENIAYFYEGYNYNCNGELYSLDLGKEQVNKIGKYNGMLRGLSSTELNNFISINESEIKVYKIDCESD